jgi:hypothetical protein
VLPPTGDEIMSSKEILFAVGGVTLLIGAAVALAYISCPAGTRGDETFRFITLLIIVMAGLTVAAGVFVRLGVASPGEAFALPSGSVRVLLAIGIMLLFVVFGVPAVTPLPSSEARLADTPMARLSVPAAERDGVANFHRSEGFTVIVNSYGNANTPAQISVYAKVKSRPAAELDLVKQLLTALVTALTTILGFYFGGRSASDAVRAIGTAVDIANKNSA